jgi:copper chaperone
MSTKTFNVPAISCGHCVHTVEREIKTIDGVKSAYADEKTKRVVVEWDTPATWEQIKNALVEIEYPPEEAQA